MPETENDPQSPEKQILTIVDRAREEITWVRSAYKFAVSIIAILIAIGLYFSHKSIQDLKADLRTDGERVQSQIKTESTLLARTLQKDLEDEITRIRGEVTARIDEEFKRENISSLVSHQAKTRIDDIADDLIKSQIAEQITPLKTNLTSLIAKSSSDLNAKLLEMDRKLSQSKQTEEELRALLTEARKTVDAVKEQSHFVLTVLAAQSDDRIAFERLRKWATDRSFALQQEARAAERDIIKSHSGFLNDAYMTISWVEDFDPKEMTIDDIRGNWMSLPSQYARAYVEFVWKHKNISKEEKLSFLHDALKDSRGSMQAASWAGKTLSKEAKVEYNPPFYFSDIEKWWSEREQAKTNAVPQDETNQKFELTVKTPGD